VTAEPTFSLIIRALARAAGVAESDLRTGSAAGAPYRDLGCFLAKRLTSRSTADIGHVFGGRGRLAVIGGIAMTVARRAEDDEFREATETLTLEIEIGARALHRLGRGLPIDADPLALAQDVMNGRRSAASLSTLETLALAGAVAAHAAQPEESAHVQQ